MNPHFDEDFSAQPENSEAISPGHGPDSTATRCNVGPATDSPRDAPLAACLSVDGTHSAFASLSSAQRRKISAVHDTLKKEHGMVVQALGKALVHAKRAGACLEKLGELVPKGLASKAREEACLALGISERTGYLYLRVHRHWQAIEEAITQDGLPLEDLSLRRALAVIPKKQRKEDTLEGHEIVTLETQASDAVASVAKPPALTSDGLTKRFCDFLKEALASADLPSIGSHGEGVAREAHNNSPFFEVVPFGKDPMPWVKQFVEAAHSNQEAILVAGFPITAAAWEMLSQVKHVVFLLMPLHADNGQG